jgi:CHAT domain-containing protein/Tfp pilus assembly protein PilF
MNLFNKAILLILTILHSLLCQSQNQRNISDSIRAVNLNRKAIQLFQNGLLPQALDTFTVSLNLRKKIWGNEDEKLASTYSGIGIIYGRLGQIDLALQNYNLAEHNYILSDKYPLKQMVSLYNNIGTIYRLKLDYNNALKYFEQALSLSINELKLPPEDFASINYNIAEIYYATKKDKKAIELIKNNINSAYAEDQILFYELLAFIYQIDQNNTKAKTNYQKAIDLTKILYDKNSIEVALAYLNYSNFLISIGQFTEAEEFADKSNLIFELNKTSNGLNLSKYFKTKGLIINLKPVQSQNFESFKTLKKQNIANAISFFKQGLKSLNFPDNYNSANLLESVKIVSLTESVIILKLIAQSYNDLVNLEQPNGKPAFTESMAKAIDTYQVISSLIQRARKEISDDKSKIELNTLEYETFNQVINISYTAYSITNDKKYIELAFQNAERLKSSAVFDKISDQLALENSLVPDSLLNLEKKLNSTIAIFSNKLFEEQNYNQPDSNLIKEYNNEIFSATRRREELSRFFENEYKDFYDLKYSNSMLSINDIQLRLKKDQVILEYVLNETDTITELFTFVIRSDKIEFYKQILSSDFSNSIENMFNFISNSKYLFTTNKDSKQFCISSYTLYKFLILPYKDQIEGKNITIIPDGKLSYIPFDALLENLPDTSRNIEFNQLSYLIRDNCINYSNSSNLLFKQSSSGKINRIRTIAFAPNYKEGESIEIAQKKYPLIPLLGVQKEVEKISKIVDTDVFIGSEATEENFRNNVEKYDIIHLAMHAFINDSLPAFSSFAFTQIKTENLTKNGLINMTDIYNLRLKARLTVLSACNTGVGQLKKGEGIMSLARGFIYAGCPAIIMSLWEVEDESGTQIMTSFYKNIKKGKSKDESLRLAKLEYLDSANSRRAHPHYWLGFVSIGDNSPLYVSYDFYFFILLILALAGVGIDQAIRIKKARKKRAL